HATSHLLAPADAGLLTDTAGGDRPLILVDDELSTGQTLLNTIEALHALAPRSRYVVLALVDMRAHRDARKVQDQVQALEQRLGTRIDVLALAKGRTKLPEGVAQAATELLAALPAEPAGEPGSAVVRDLAVTLDVPAGGRHGIDPAQRDRLAGAMAEAARGLAAGPDETVLVLGTEEFMAAPLLLAGALTDQPGRTVRYSTTTRSPAAAIDDDGYPLRSAITFAAPALDDDPDLSHRFAYNVRRPQGWDRIVLVVDEPQDGPRLREGHEDLPGLVPLLTGCADRVDVLTVKESL
ncbi:phosphoribosyltransferase domain-containing protein, partial [Micrococcus sp.]|uniref:phosphoribosyltransferase domain-containing protein n=1 Tax=Micrococcus sp. TaxID=1271 RepID=UPI0026DBF94D